VNRLAAVIALVGVILIGASIVIYVRMGPRPAPAPAVAVAKPPEPAPPPAPIAVPAPSPAAVDAPSPEPPDRPAARRAPAATKAPAPTAAAAPAPTAAAPSTGTLTITSDVAGAQVFLDRVFVGITPATAKEVAPGSHQLNVSAPGFDNHVQTIDVAAGARDIAIAFREVRLDAAIDVVHKHRMGSCKGRLIATPRGIRYETSDKDDAFSAPLLELDTFQVDYLTKNLRVQPRKGKRYDFADPDGNADRLFVFHRDVDRVRERLKKGDVPAAQDPPDR